MGMSAERALGMSERQTGEGGASARAKAGAIALAEHGPLLAKVAMALVGEQEHAEKVLEAVAREVATLDLGSDPRVALLGRVRAACAAHATRAPLRSRPGAGETAASEAAAARRKLGRLRPTEREALVLHLVGGLDVRGVAAACGGISEEVARQRVTSAMSQMLEEDGR